MRRLIVGAVLALAIGASAAPKPRVTWADWVGDYEGKLVWKGCTTPGEKTAVLALDAIDGAVAIDLTPMGGGLRPISLADNDDDWIAQQGDVTVRLVRSRAHTIQLAVAIGSDCTVHGVLRRPSTKISACDELIGWTRIEAACTKVGDTRLENPAALAVERPTWKPGKKAIAERCATRAATLETALIAAGCALDPVPASVVRAPDCARFVEVARRFQRCDLALDEVKWGALADAQSLFASVTTADDASVRVLEQQCRDAYARLARVAAHSRCPL